MAVPNLGIDALAVFGDKDTKVNWRKAHALYESTLGRNPRATLTTQVFPNANHALNVSNIGSVREVEGTPLDAGMKVPGYQEAQLNWRRKFVVLEQRRG